MPRKSEDSPTPEGWPPRPGGKKIIWNWDGKVTPKLAAVPIAVLALLLAMFVFTQGPGGVGLVDIGTTEVAVIVSYMSGDTEVVNKPGFRLVLPYFQRAYKFDKSPVKFVMKGKGDIDHNRLRQLTVRADDGSEYHFDEIEIQYRVIEAEIARLLQDSGPGIAFKRNWVKAFARSVLRDEFGRYTAEQGADPTVYDEATQKAKARLNVLLNPHGLEVISIIPRIPKFHPDYERAIEDRKLADQTVEKLKVKAERLVKERERILAEVDLEKQTQLAVLKGELAAAEVQASEAAVKRKRSADAFKIQQVNDGIAVRDRLKAEARALTEQARKEAEGLRLRVEALAQRGEILVREALASKLAGITFNIVPYRRDPSPLRIEHLGGVVVPGKEGAQ